MKEYINALDNLPLIVKIILALPAIDILWGIYRILYALVENNTTALIVSIVLLFLQPFVAIFDIVMLLLNGKVWRLTQTA